MIYRYLFWHASEEMAVWWRNAVRQILAEEESGIHDRRCWWRHPAIDQEFQRNIVAAIGALQSPRYQNIGQLIESVLATSRPSRQLSTVMRIRFSS